MIGQYIVFGFVIGHVTHVVCQTATDVKNLQTELFVTNEYNKKIRPIENQTEPIDVYVSFNLNNINGLNEVDEVLQTTGFLMITWKDEFLKWDPANFGDLYETFWPQTDIWKPDVTLRNSNKKHKELGQDSLNVGVDSDGTVTWFPMQVFESTCDIDIRSYPFDEQTCHMNFVSWSYSIYEVQMYSGDKGLMLDEYEPNPTWEIIDTSWSIKESKTDAEITFSITIKRKPLFVTITILLPIVLLSILNILVFVLPSESGERSGYAVTVFLALVVFLSIVSTFLPANSETISVFSIYLIIQTVVSTLTTFIALITIRLNNLDEDTPIPSCIIAILRAKDRLTCSKGQRKKGTAKTPDSKGQYTNKENEPITSRSIEMKESGKTASESSNEVQPKYKWKHVNNFLDAVFLIFFSAVCLISTIVCFTVSATGG